MNIKISKKEAILLFGRSTQYYPIGSHLYGTMTKESDEDILVFYTSFDHQYDHIFQIRHQFQWDDEKNNIDYIFTTREQFCMNLFSGESTINADLVLLYKNENFFKGRELELCRTFNIIKAYIGFAKRDIKFIGKDNKDRFFHSVRGLYTASCLLDNKLPELKHIQEIKQGEYSKTKEELKIWHDELRSKCNKEYESDNLPMYPKITTGHDLYQKLVDSVNIKEFRY